MKSIGVRRERWLYSTFRASIPSTRTATTRSSWRKEHMRTRVRPQQPATAENATRPKLHKILLKIGRQATSAVIAGARRADTSSGRRSRPKATIRSAEAPWLRMSQASVDLLANIKRHGLTSVRMLSSEWLICLLFSKVLVQRLLPPFTLDLLENRHVKNPAECTSFWHSDCVVLVIERDI
jgi:hypothetical protein